MKIAQKIDLSVEQINCYKTKYSLSESAFSESFILLNSLKSELDEFKTVQNERLLRGFKDLCTNISRNFEEEDFAVTIFEIADYFSKSFPSYDSLDLLRDDFGKQKPI